MKVLLFIVLISAPVFAQFSPGDLSKAHANLEGLSNCTKCHELGEKVVNTKCLDCHDEIRSSINAGFGYHSSGDVKGKLCSKCHAEHFGRKYKLIKFDPNSFDHGKTSYRLTGAHAKAKCEDCHQAKNIIDPKLKKRKGTYLGLDEYCLNCHEDYHQKTLGDDCNSCHNNEKFRPAEKFDHQKAKFKLTGEHKKVDCIKCHPKQKKNGKDFQKFTGLKFNNCSSCHNDIHQGKFGNNCAQCHVTTGFTVINRKKFDHSKTDYPLVGKHKLVNCDQCHKTSIKTKPKHTKCLDCHEDFHKGQFVVNNVAADCIDCHSVNGFSPSTVTIEKHNLSKFKLTGAHLAIPCRNCHYKNEQWQFRELGLDCIECHKNIHGSEVTEKFLPENKCTACHSTESWVTISFDHKRTEFELLGKHKEQTCGGCHYKDKSDNRSLLFKSLRKDCEECHTDIHVGQFKEGGVSDCTKCHSFENWKPEKFDHEKTRFSLKGAHEKLNCIKCHPVVELNKIKYIKYKLADFRCSACHS